jgi:hypothetical protein
MHDIVCETDDALSFTILQRSLGTQYPQEHAMGEEEGPSARVVKFPLVLALDVLDGGAELCGHI